MLTKCLIANRGEIAVRVIRACRELGIRVVCVYTPVDAQSLHVQLADEAFAVENYLQGQALVDVALAAGCDCVHPGYGFLSESADFAQMVLDAGLTWIGPAPATIRSMGEKPTARQIMTRAGVPIVPSVDGTENDQYPLIIKAAGGGGGKGMRIVQTEPEMADALASAQREAEKAFGNPDVFIERYLQAAHHIEVQIVADTQGNIVHLFERECSSQRRHQKIVEETPSPSISPELRAAICETAVKAARAVDYVNLGTVEFIVQGDEFYFLEMNTRLQVEHPVTEYVTGIDLVKLQFQIAAGKALPFTQDRLQPRGHAIEARIYAEDPSQQFLPGNRNAAPFALAPYTRGSSGLWCATRR